MENVNLNKNIKYILIAISVIACIITFRSCVRNGRIELIGDDQIYVYQNRRYIDPGYNIINASNGYYVNVEGFVNINRVGSYYLNYMLYNKHGKLVSSVIRTVIVLEDKYSDVSMYLKGEDEEYYFVDDYFDLGIEVYDGSNDITDEINIDSNVKENIVGDYEVRYQVYNNGIVKEAVRRVHIIDLAVEEEIDEANLSIDLTIKCKSYYYTVLPNMIKTYSKYASHYYNEIGDYEFDIYLKNGSHRKYIAYVDNIDKEGPVGTCIVSYEGNKTTITMNATDSSGVTKYSYNGVEFYDKTRTMNSIATNVIIRAYDKYNNYTDIKCKAELTDGFRTVPIDSNGTIQNKIGWTTCNTNTTQESLELDNIIQAYGYKTRGAVAMAATYLANYKYRIQYFWGGKTAAKGIDSNWGCAHTHSASHRCTKALASDFSSCEYGLDCAGYIKWSYIQAGFDESIIRGEDTTTHKWGNFNPKPNVHKFSEGRMYSDQIKPGDIVHKPGHVGIVIGVDKDTVQVAEMKMYGIAISILDKNTGATKTNQNSFPEFLLMDEYFKMYGN